MPILIDVLANDYDPDGDTLTIFSLGVADHGALVIQDGRVQYSPELNYNGPDSFVYTISDGHGGFDQATVQITVAPVNDPPVALDDAAVVEKNGAVLIDVLDNDYDIEGDTISISNFSQGSTGSVTLLRGKLLYQPNQDFTGTDTFVYEITDGQDTDTATVTIDVSLMLGEDWILDNAPHNIDTDGDGHYDGFQLPGTGIYYRGGFTRFVYHQGYLLDVAYSDPDSGNTATYDFTPVGLEDGEYLVAVTWSVHSNRATNAPFTVTTESGARTTPINQRVAPDDFNSDGAVWETLGAFRVTNSELTITLTDVGADGFVIADAVRVSRIAPVNVDVMGEIGVLDEGEDGYTCTSCSSFLVNPQIKQANYNDFDILTGDNSGDYASWDVNVIPTFSYLVGVSWQTDPTKPSNNRATDVKYTISSGANSSSVQINQELYASDNQGGLGAGAQLIDGRYFQVLGALSLTRKRSMSRSPTTPTEWWSPTPYSSREFHRCWQPMAPLKLTAAAWTCTTFKPLPEKRSRPGQKPI